MGDHVGPTTFGTIATHMMSGPCYDKAAPAAYMVKLLAMLGTKL